MITIREIAEQLGVSPTTVSNVINGRTGKMSEETRRRVEEALVENHYMNGTRNEKAGGTLRLVSVNFCLGEKRQIMTDPFCGSLMEGLTQSLHKHGLCAALHIPQDEEGLLRGISARNIEGSIILGCDPAQCAPLRRRVARPVVFIDSGEGDYDNVGLEDAQGAGNMTNFLLRQGHSRIAFFFDHDAGTHSNRERYRGFSGVMGAHGMEVQPQDCFVLPASKHLRHAVLRFFAREKAGKVYTAAFFVCDLHANEAINIFFDEGVRVPEDISVTGFDDNIYARLARPLLTTVRQRPEDKASAAVDLLVKRMSGRRVEVNSIRLPTELIVRDSVKNIAGSAR